MNTITRNEENKDFFKAIQQMDLDPDMDYSIAVDKDEEYRGRGSTFYVVYYIEITKESQDQFGDIDILPYIGTWKTDRIIEDTEYGSDDEFYSLTRVERKEKVVTTTEWIEVK